MRKAIIGCFGFFLMFTGCTKGFETSESLSKDQYLQGQNANGTPVLQSSILAPMITVQPESSSNYAGAAVTLWVQAESSEAITYQWYGDGIAIPGATSSQLTVQPPAAQNDYVPVSYHVVISNSLGGETSDTAYVVIELPEPRVVVDPNKGPSRGNNPQPATEDCRLAKLVATPSGQHIRTEMVYGALECSGSYGFKVYPDPGYILSTKINGSCPKGTWNKNLYETEIMADCEVIFLATAALPSVGVGTGSPIVP